MSTIKRVRDKGDVGAEWYFATNADLARACNYSEGTIKQMIRAKVFTRERGKGFHKVRSLQALVAHLAKKYNMPGQRGHYDLNEIDAWRERHKLRRKRSVVASPEDDLVEARRKLAVAKREEARAIREQHAAEREQGKLIDRVEAQKREEQIIDWAVSVMELAEAELPDQLVGKTAGAIRERMREWFTDQRHKSLMTQT